MVLIILKNKLYRWLLAGLGSGWLPVAPGTWGSLASLPLFYLIAVSCEFNHLILLIAIILVTVLGCVLSGIILPQLDAEDPGWIVLDEWAGQWLTVLLCLMLMDAFAMQWSQFYVWVSAFVLFRLFDIFKPFPIRQSEHIGPPWWSIMADDLLAGFMAAASFAVVLWMLEFL